MESRISDFKGINQIDLIGLKEQWDSITYLWSSVVFGGVLLCEKLPKDHVSPSYGRSQPLVLLNSSNSLILVEMVCVEF